MKIEDMGDHTRVPDQPKDCHYWPDCTCGRAADCWLLAPDDADRRQVIAFMIVAATVIVSVCLLAGAAFAIYAALNAPL